MHRRLSTDGHGRAAAAARLWLDGRRGPGVHPVRPRTGGALMAVVTRAVRWPGVQGGRGLPGVRRSGARPGRPCGDAAGLLVSGLSGISVRPAGCEAGGDRGLRLAAALSGWQGGRRRAGGGDPARARRERYLGPAADLACTPAPVRRRQAQAVTADGMAGSPEGQPQGPAGA